MSTTTLSSPQDSDAWALLSLKESAASPTKQHNREPCVTVLEDSINNVAHHESICVSATVENNTNCGGGTSDGGTSSPSNSLENVHPQLQFTEKGGRDKLNGHTKAPIAKLKGKEFEFLVRQERLVIGRNSSTKGTRNKYFLFSCYTLFNEKHKYIQLINCKIIYYIQF